MDLERAARVRTQAQCGRPGGLVLGHAEVRQERAHAHHARRLVDPCPGHVLPPPSGDAGEALDGRG